MFKLKSDKYLVSKRENRHILKMPNVSPEMAGKITCEIDGDKTACDFQVSGEYCAFTAFAAYACLGDSISAHESLQCGLWVMGNSSWVCQLYFYNIYISSVSEPLFEFIDPLKDTEVLERNSGELVCLVSHEIAPVCNKVSPTQLTL